MTDRSKPSLHDTPTDTLESVVRARLEAARGPEYWRSLEELAGSPEFQERLRQEFAPQADVWPEHLDRRRFLQVMGASMALAGLASCTRQPLETIVPYVRAPENQVPGKPKYYATAHRMLGYASGILVESHMGRPTKIEGNRDHPTSRGATDRFAQASILDLYDPDRARAVRHRDRIRTWQAFDAELASRLESHAALGGEGLRFLTGATTSPTLGRQMQQVRGRFPKARWHRWEAAGRDAARAAALTALGKVVDVIYDFSKADVVVALDADFLTEGPGHLAYARDFMARRRVDEGGTSNRLYAIESVPSNTGAVADHRLAMDADELVRFAVGLAAQCKVHGAGRLPENEQGVQAQWLRIVGDQLRRTAGRCIVVAGEQAAHEVHVLALAINAMLGNFGKTVHAIDPVEPEAGNELRSLRELVADMHAGRVETLLILDGNPVFDAPRDLDFAAALDKVEWRAHLSTCENETSERCMWHLPMTHDLEAWSDARAYDGTATVMQPLIEPLFNCRSIHEVLARVVGEGPQKGYDIVRETWKARAGAADFESWWRRVLHDGLVPESAYEPRIMQFQREAVISVCREILTEAVRDRRRGEDEVTLQLRPDPNVFDGRFANNGWLQELPKPWTRLTWDNALWIAPALAAARSLQNGDVVRLEVREAALEVPVWVVPGHPEHAVTLHYGFGRRRAGRVGDGVGVDAYAVRFSSGLATVPHVRLEPTGERRKLACTQDHSSMEGRHLVRTGTLRQYREHPEFVHEMEHHVDKDLTLYPEDHPYEGNAWGLSIDLGACTGCNACVVACNAENNIPVVGKEQVLAAREMHWLRIDRYFEGAPEAPQVAQQPVMCQQCENAPCEVVCPVGATVHSDEGLNDMVYNRCVGTRYCSNNCPYKVRRFNFLAYSDQETDLLKLMRNPDVSVRTRGVMEKCTYCVQRISQARIQAKKEGRPIADGEIVTACQQVCPTEAIVFGDINDPDSEVSRRRRLHRHYGILEELNTRPRTTYLARIVNPHPDLEGAKHGH